MLEGESCAAACGPLSKEVSCADPNKVDEQGTPMMFLSEQNYQWRERERRMSASQTASLQG